MLHGHMYVVCVNKPDKICDTDIVYFRVDLSPPPLVPLAHTGHSCPVPPRSALQELTAYTDRSFTFQLSTPQTTWMLKRCAGIEKVSVAAHPCTERIYWAAVFWRDELHRFGATAARHGLFRGTNQPSRELLLVQTLYIYIFIYFCGGVVFSWTLMSILAVCCARMYICSKPYLCACVLGLHKYSC